MDNAPNTKPQAIIRTTQLGKLSWGLALALSLAVGTYLSAGQTPPPTAYLLSLAVFVPVALAVAERAAAVRSRTVGGLYALLPDGAVRRKFIGGWLLLLGYGSLIALLTHGLGNSLGDLLGTAWGLALPPRLLGLLPLLPALFVALSQTLPIGRWRVALTYGSLGGLVLLGGRLWLHSIPAPATVSPPSLWTSVALLAAGLWSLDLLLGYRRRMPPLRRKRFLVLLVPVVASSLLGIWLFAAPGFPPAGRAKSVLALLNLLPGCIALIGVLRAALDLLALSAESPRQQWGGGILVLATAFLLPPSLAPGVAALTFLWFTALLNAPALWERTVRTSPSFRLPFFPLFPGLAAAIGLLLPLALPLPVWPVGGAWLLIGGGIWVLYGRRRSRRDREEVALRPTDAELPEGPTVLAAVTDPYSAPTLIEAGARLAHARHARLIILQVLALSAQIPQKMRRMEAEGQLETVKGYLQRVSLPSDLQTTILVRTAETEAEGIIAAAQEEEADLLLLAWTEKPRREVMDRLWAQVAGAEEPTGTEEADKKAPTDGLPPLLDTVVRRVPCAIAILRGPLPTTVAQVQVMAAEADQEALTLARSLVADEGKVDVRPTPSAEADLLIVHAARPGLLEQEFFGAQALAAGRSRPSLLFRPPETAHRLWLRREWAALTALFTPLTEEDRAQVSAQMRRAARPSINFFVLITLAATIASFGLLQNSAAVIIGAMLVAPLMSPIASMAMGIVEGDIALMRVAGEAIAKGVALAVGVGVVITLISPDPFGLDQILGRTRPVLLDLGVALASGAAAGYALSRKEVSAALPGVSISVALVPPLCVVGYGLAKADLGVAGGAFLLFSTNVIAIILAAALVFLLLGFRPLPAQEEYFRRGLLVSVASLLLIAIPLGVLLNISLDRQKQVALRQRVEAVLAEEFPPDRGRVVSVRLTAEEEGYLVDITLYDFGSFDDAAAAQLQERIAEAIGAEAKLRAIVLNARQVGEAP